MCCIGGISVLPPSICFDDGPAIWLPFLRVCSFPTRSLPTLTAMVLAVPETGEACLGPGPPLICIEAGPPSSSYPETKPTALFGFVSGGSWLFTGTMAARLSGAPPPSGTSAPDPPLAGSLLEDSPPSLLAPDIWLPWAAWA